MTILSDVTIKEMCDSNTEHDLIFPFISHQVREIEGKKIVSYGLSSAGYDVRLRPHYKLFTNVHGTIIDPLEPSNDIYVDMEGDSVIIPPNSYLLGETVEHFNVPDNIAVLAVGKSTWARLGVILNVTPIEPGFKGTVVIELANTTTLPVRVHAGMGIGQFVFHELDRPCEVSYGDRGGKYQNQSGITTARL